MSNVKLRSTAEKYKILDNVDVKIEDKIDLILSSLSIYEGIVNYTLELKQCIVI